MNRIEINEWYDGEIQAVLEHDGTYYYAVCVNLDPRPAKGDRRFLLVPIEDHERVALKAAFESGDLSTTNQVLAQVLDGRRASIARGDIDHWAPAAMRFDIDTSNYRYFFRFPLIDFG